MLRYSSYDLRRCSPNAHSPVLVSDDRRVLGSTRSHMSRAEVAQGTLGRQGIELQKKTGIDRVSHQLLSEPERERSRFVACDVALGRENHAGVAFHVQRFENLVAIDSRVNTDRLDFIGRATGPHN